MYHARPVVTDPGPPACFCTTHTAACFTNNGHREPVGSLDVTHNTGGRGSHFESGPHAGKQHQDGTEAGYQRRGSWGNNVRQRMANFESSGNPSPRENLYSEASRQNQGDSIQPSSSFSNRSTEKPGFCGDRSSTRYSKSSSDLSRRCNHFYSKDDNRTLETERTHDIGRTRDILRNNTGLQNEQGNYIESLLLSHRRKKSRNPSQARNRQNNSNVSTGDSTLQNTPVKHPPNKHVGFYDDSVVSSDTEVLHQYERARVIPSRVRSPRSERNYHIKPAYQGEGQHAITENTQVYSDNESSGTRQVRSPISKPPALSKRVENVNKGDQKVTIKAEIHEHFESRKNSSANVARWAENNRHFDVLHSPSKLLPDKPKVPILKHMNNSKEYSIKNSQGKIYSENTLPDNSVHSGRDVSMVPNKEISKSLDNLRFSQNELQLNQQDDWKTLSNSALSQNVSLDAFEDQEDMFATINNVSAFVMRPGTNKGQDMSEFKDFAPELSVVSSTDTEPPNSDPDLIRHESSYLDKTSTKPQNQDITSTDWDGVVQDLFYNLDNVDLKTDPLIAEHNHDSSSGIASDVTSSHNQSTTRMSTFKGDSSSVSSADHRFSDSSFDRQFSDSSLSTDRPYVKKRQGDGKFPWAYTHGAKVAQQNKTNRERVPLSSDSSSVNSDYPTPVIHTTQPPSYEYHMQLQKQKHFIHNNYEVQDTDRLMLTSSKVKYKVRPSPFDLMTDDVIVKIFSSLPTDQLCRCSCVSQRWYRLAWDPLLWKKIAINSESVHIDHALRYLTKRLSYNTPTVCVIVERINLNGCEKLTDKGLHAIAKSCPELRHLEIQGCANVTNAALFEVVSYCVNLEYLDVTGCPCVTCIRLTDKLLAQATAPHLRQIYLRYLDLTDCSALDDAGLVTVSSYCTQLQYLFLRRCVRIGDQGVEAVCNNCSNLRELSVSDCKRLTDYGASEISKLSENLRYLSVAKCEKVSDVAIIQIARGCRKLRYLNVRGCEAVSDDSLDTIARNLTRLKSLDIGKCDITDEGLVALGYCSQLRKLSVKSCDAITDLGIVTIAQHCHKLQQLNIQDCHVTLEAYRTVKKHCKRCLIEHTNPGFC